jgi:hypothetical protein
MTVMSVCVLLSALKAQTPTPQQLVQTLATAAQNGDVERFLQGLSDDSRKRVLETFANQDQFVKALGEFRAALNERFGNADAPIEAPPDDLQKELQHFAGAEVTQSQEQRDGSVRLKVRTNLKQADGKTINVEQSLVARKEGGAWKVVLGIADNASVTAQRLAAAETVTKDVRAGKYQDRTAAMTALANAWNKREGSKR